MSSIFARAGSFGTTCVNNDSRAKRRAENEALDLAVPENMSDQLPQHILILGCGYVGTALAKRLVLDGHNVVATTTTDSRMREIADLGAMPLLLSLRESDRLHDALADREVVFLCVASGRKGQSYGELYAQGARRLVGACRNTAVRRIVYTSSTRGYAQDDGSWVDEDSPTNPLDDDGQALVAAEQVLLDAPRMEFVPPESFVSVLRLGGIHGPGRELAPRVHKAAGTNRSDGNAFLNLIHLEDIVETMTKLLTVEYRGVLNVCDGRPVLRRELYDREIARVGILPIRWTKTCDAIRGKRVCIERLRRTLQLSPRPHI